METGQIILYSFIAVLFIAMMIYFIFYDKDVDLTSLQMKVDENKMKSTDILEKQMNRELKKASKLNLINYETVDQNESTID